MNEKILVIDDDTELTSLLHAYLGNNGFIVSAVEHPDDGLTMIENEMPDAIILDIMLPDMDGFTVCKEIRKKYSVPVLMLTAKGDVQDRIVGLEIGADDYLAKPFEPRELVARLRSILRRVSDSNGNGHIDRFGDLVIDFDARNVKIGSDDINLTTNEYLLLEHLIHNKGRVLDRNQLVDYLRGIDWESSNRSIDMLISRIRQKLHDDSHRPLYIRTVTGTGYVFVGKKAG